MTAAEKAALAWLCSNFYNRHEGHIATLKAMLAEPRLPKEPTPEALRVLRVECESQTYSPAAMALHGYRALHAHLARPHVDFSALDEARMDDSSDAGASPFDPWQPIDTAPKDGTEILLARFKSDHDVVVCMWAEESSWLDEPSGQWNLTTERQDAHERFPATHWQLLRPPVGNHGRGSKAAGGKSQCIRSEPHNCTPAARDELRKAISVLRGWSAEAAGRTGLAESVLIVCNAAEATLPKTMVRIRGKGLDFTHEGPISLSEVPQ